MEAPPMIDHFLQRIMAIEKQCYWFHQQMEILQQQRVNDSRLIQGAEADIKEMKRVMNILTERIERLEDASASTTREKVKQWVEDWR